MAPANTVAIQELPPPPEGKTGWPWTEGTRSPKRYDLSGKSWPTVSLVTPSLNQGAFLEEAIRSVLLQGYPYLEYIVIDGGSSDESIEVIRKYGRWLTYWQSETDRGQAAAINEGFRRTSGTIMAWLNSDDRYYPGSIFQAAAGFRDDATCDWIAGGIDWIDETGNPLKSVSAYLPSSWRNYALFENGHFLDYAINQPATFWSRRMWEACGPLDEKLHYCMDRSLWMTALARGFEPCRVDDLLASFRRHRSSKTVTKSARFAFEGAYLHGTNAWRSGFRTVPNLLVAQRLLLRGLRIKMAGREPLRGSNGR